MDVKRLVRKSGHTQRELAGFLDMDEFQFSKKLNGWRGARFDEADMKKLEEHGVDVSQLYPDPDPAPEAA